MTVEGWENWAEATNEAERRSAQQLTHIEEGDSFGDFLTSIVVECYSVVERPAHRRVYFEAPSEDTRLVFYAVRGKYVFVLDPDDLTLVTGDWTDDDEALFDDVSDFPEVAA